MNNEWIEKRKIAIIGKRPESSAKTCLDETPESSTYVDCGGCMWLLAERCNWCTMYELQIPDGVVPLGCGKGEANLPF